MFLNVKLSLKKTRIFRYLQNKISSKDSENMKSKNQYWVPVLFRPCGGTILKTVIILSWK